MNEIESLLAPSEKDSLANVKSIREYDLV